MVSSWPAAGCALTRVCVEKDILSFSLIRASWQAPDTFGILRLGGWLALVISCHQFTLVGVRYRGRYIWMSPVRTSPLDICSMNSRR